MSLPCLYSKVSRYYIVPHGNQGFNDILDQLCPFNMDVCFSAALISLRHIVGRAPWCQACFAARTLLKTRWKSSRRRDLCQGDCRTAWRRHPVSDKIQSPSHLKVQEAEAKKEFRRQRHLSQEEFRLRLKELRNERVYTWYEMWEIRHNAFVWCSIVCSCLALIMFVLGISVGIHAPAKMPLCENVTGNVVTSDRCIVKTLEWKQLNQAIQETP
jgi:hypothetical protein